MKIEEKIRRLTLGLIALEKRVQDIEYGIRILGDSQNINQSLNPRCSVCGMDLSMIDNNFVCQFDPQCLFTKTTEVF